MATTTEGAAAPALAEGRRHPRRRNLQQRKRTRAAWGFLSPAVVILAVFVLYPMAHAATTSFTNASLFGASKWVGLANYRHLLHDPHFKTALVNTVLYAVVTTPISVLLALGVALLLNSRIPARGLFRAAIFFPFVASLAIASIAWSFILDPQVGIVSVWLSDVGVSIGQGVRDPSWAMPAVMLVGIWRNVGFFMVMYLAGLQSIPRELQEAAYVDGAGPVKRFRYLTLPLLSNTTMFVTIIAAIFAFQSFDQIYVMTSGGPFFKTETLVMMIYNTGFQDYNLGYASAMSWVLVAIILVISLTQLRVFNRKVVRY
jgi:ABC-type sugar transport system permease subunit